MRFRPCHVAVRDPPAPSSVVTRTVKTFRHVHRLHRQPPLLHTTMNPIDFVQVSWAGSHCTQIIHANTKLPLSTRTEQFTVLHSTRIPPLSLPPSKTTFCVPMVFASNENNDILFDSVGRGQTFLVFFSRIYFALWFFTIFHRGFRCALSTLQLPWSIAQSRIYSLGLFVSVLLRPNQRFLYTGQDVIYV